MDPTLKYIYIYAYVGGGLYISIQPQLSQNNIQLKLQIEVVHNFLVQDNVRVYGYIFRLLKDMASSSAVYISLE